MKNIDIIRLFNELKNDPNMHTDTYFSGCIQRTGKVLERIPEACFAVFMGENGQDISCLETKTTWKQHYVPIVFDEEQNPLVLDICLMDGPERLEDYKKHFQNLSLLFGPEAELGLGDLNTYSSASAQNILDQISVSAKDKIVPNKVKSNWLEGFNLDQIKKLKVRTSLLNRRIVQ